MDPPTPLFPVPTSTLIPPARPPAADPESTNSAPELPAEPRPVWRDKVPDSPLVKAGAVKMETAPENLALEPERNVTDPPATPPRLAPPWNSTLPPCAVAAPRPADMTTEPPPPTASACPTTILTDPEELLTPVDVPEDNIILPVLLVDEDPVVKSTAPVTNDVNAQPEAILMEPVDKL